MTERAYYSAEISNFLNESVDSIIGKITQKHPQSLEHLQTGAWSRQIEILQKQLSAIAEGHILFEVQIPRMGKRADVVLIHRDIIFVLEFKVGADNYLAQDIRQAHGYALDLSSFHEGSHAKTIVPILIATKALASEVHLIFRPDHVYEPLTINELNIYQAIRHCIENIRANEPINYEEWISSAYKPTPNIIEAAQALYSNHDVKNIARHDASAQNLRVTSKSIQDIVHSARLNNNKTICFVTGVPGAGKTLVGLNIATAQASKTNDEHAVFLSGNGPLVEVLREALVRDQVDRCPGTTKEKASREVESMIQNIHHFRDEALKDLRKAPPERVVIFDEAQRAWNLASTSKFMTQKRGQENFNQSEPEFLISVMDRHEDWCVIVALIGGGQEINTGEAGLQGWFDALATKFPNWHVHYSSKLSQIEYAGGDLNFSDLPNVKAEPSLHLATSMRSFRAEKLSHMVHYVIHNQAEAAADCYKKFKHKFPIKITRDLSKAKAWIKAQARANETKGVVASSGATRLKPEGIFVKNRLSAADWFLNDVDDVRSCHFLEDVATEFDIQGLELDWCLVGWDADYRYGDRQFEHWKFTGTTWKQRHQEAQKRYLENAYRVLLTRARHGMVIFVPSGDDADQTRYSTFYDCTFSYLLSCGLDSL
ncbi:DUF2075 domain-containing protein [Undibacterium terreum]|uniref:Schlafen group 3-like DNA/RNA helicase domain-containing protein n=1 Tax=Undibacterium terreum TaxID=1224302 RepID=A0A916V1G4_9BURK|nr:DUF2075 domain-containing protein [Undibacterium terreum]GGC96225.1 hypothetical protein GCM10011396_49540 [Undibacterium terreum]